MAVRVAIIGGGMWARFHILATKELEGEDKAQLVSLAARTEKTVNKHTEAYGIDGYTDWKEMIEKVNPDAVCIVTPDHLHREMTLYALERGCHVMVEKPMDLSTSGCHEMVNLADQKDLLLAVDFHKRYDPYNIDVMRKVRDGKIGNPYYAYAYMEDRLIVPAEWLSSWAAESTPFWFIGVHKYDLVRWITGKEAVSVMAHGYKGKLTELGIDTYDAVSAAIEMEDGFTCTIHANWILPDQFEAFVNQGLRIVGSEGMVELDTQDRGLRYVMSSDGMVTSNLGTFFSEESVFGWEAVQGYFVDPIKDFLLNVFYLNSGGELKELEGRYPSGVDGMKVTQLAEAVEMSVEENRVVAVDEIG